MSPLPCGTHHRPACAALSGCFVDDVESSPSWYQSWAMQRCASGYAISSGASTTHSRPDRAARAPACPFSRSLAVNSGHSCHLPSGTQVGILLIRVMIAARSSKLAMRIRFPWPTPPSPSRCRPRRDPFPPRRRQLQLRQTNMRPREETTFIILYPAVARSAMKAHCLVSGRLWYNLSLYPHGSA
jgi:hypothetical protein